MCVVAMAGASLAASAASSLIGGIGAQDTAKAQSEAASYQSQVANNNANLAISQGNVNAGQIQQQGDQKDAMARAAMAASGVDVNSGSALAVQKGIGQTTGVDVANTRYNAAVQATGFRGQSVLDAQQSQNDQLAGNNAMLGSMLGGATQFSSKWASFAQNGSLPGGGTGSMF